MPEWFLKGGPVMYVLLGCSAVAVALILERAVFWWGERRRVDWEELDRFLDRIAGGELSRAQTYAGECDSELPAILWEEFQSRRDEPEPLLSALDQELDRTIRRSNAFLPGLDTLTRLTPLLGIFGTVLGIIQSFHAIGASAVPDPQLVGAGLAEALITTAAGLAVAMPSLIFHNLFRSLSERHLDRLEQRIRTVNRRSVVSESVDESDSTDDRTSDRSPKPAPEPAAAEGAARG